MSENISWTAMPRIGPGVAILMVAGAIASALVLTVLVTARETWGVVFVLVCTLLAGGVVVTRVSGRAVLWILLFLNIIVTDVGVFREVTGDDALHAQALVKVAVCAVTAVLGFVWLRSTLIERGGVAIGVYLLACALSTTYSLDPRLSASAVFVLVSQTILVLGLVSTYRDRSDLRLTMNIVIGCLTAKCAASWTFAFIQPSIGFVESTGLIILGDLPRLAGLSNPNVTGFGAALLFVLATADSIRTGRPRLRDPRLYAALLGLLTVLFSQSRTSIVAAMGGIGAYLLVSRGRRLLLAIIASAVLLGGVWEWSTEDLAWMSSRGGNEEETLSLNGRTAIWRGTVDALTDRPLFGFGYGAGRIVVPAVTLHSGARPFYSAHNQFLESLVNVGIPGTLLLSWIVFVGLFRSLRLAERDRVTKGRERMGGLLFAASVVMFLNGLAESGAASILTIQSFLVPWLYATTTWAHRAEEMTARVRGRSSVQLARRVLEIPRS